MREEGELFVSRRVAGGFTDGIEGAACDGDGNVYAVDLARAGTVGRIAPKGLDGMRCDVAGNVYVTRHGKGVVAVLAPDGTVVREIRLERGRRCTNLAFGGPDWRTVYVTVADCGHVEAFRVDVPGRAGALWGGWAGGARC